MKAPHRFSAANAGSRSLDAARWRTIEANLFPAALPAVEPWQTFRWHSAAGIAYVSLLVLAWPHRVWRWPALAGVVLIVGGVGFGQVYLAVPWPTDVAAGYLLAGIWLCSGLALRDYRPATCKTG